MTHSTLSGYREQGPVQKRVGCHWEAAKGKAYANPPGKRLPGGGTWFMQMSAAEIWTVRAHLAQHPAPGYWR